MHSLILFIKTYRPDFERANNLIRSIEKHNKDEIPVIISVNDEDFDFFKDKLKEYNIYKDSDIIIADNKDGWRYQQIVKSHVYRLNICENYLCIDSDSEFIKDFHYSDFLYDESTPYTIMHESKPFLETMENIQLDSENIFFKEALRATRPLFGNKGKEWDYGPSPYLWSCKVWNHFIEVYLKQQNKTFIDFFNEIDKVTSPSECVIYGEYLLKSKLIDIYPVEGFFKVYHYEKQYRLEKKFHNIEKLKKIYLGVIFQSNWEKRKRFGLF
ncbi:hypothetical protein FY557_06095 [Chryseobacterium sp. SN22]|uniref:DUF6492 family protein n=1 Tax=Chryseobacterium sp. SN22 TaxID=2606431 RepID=UPI0011ED007F|nr:DUF6492 family protein [Chryseobacterium sp. SN22]KAA0129133.1 hypothetical protein FY557_06095 [Chryseobacterium sp. SN22]